MSTVSRGASTSVQISVRSSDDSNNRGNKNVERSRKSEVNLKNQNSSYKQDPKTNKDNNSYTTSPSYSSVSYSSSNSKYKTDTSSSQKPPSVSEGAYSPPNPGYSTDSAPVYREVSMLTELEVTSKLLYKQKLESDKNFFGTADKTQSLLRGTIDTHIGALKDNVPRIDSLKAAKITSSVTSKIRYAAQSVIAGGEGDQTTAAGKGILAIGGVVKEAGNTAELVSNLASKKPNVYVINREHVLNQPNFLLDSIKPPTLSELGTKVKTASKAVGGTTSTVGFAILASKEQSTFDKAGAASYSAVEAVDTISSIVEKLAPSKAVQGFASKIGGLAGKAGIGLDATFAVKSIVDSISVIKDTESSIEARNVAIADITLNSTSLASTGVTLAGAAIGGSLGGSLALAGTGVGVVVAVAALGVAIARKVDVDTKIAVNMDLVKTYKSQIGPNINVYDQAARYAVNENLPQVISSLETINEEFTGINIGNIYTNNHVADTLAQTTDAEYLKKHITVPKPVTTEDWQTISRDDLNKLYSREFGLPRYPSHSSYRDTTGAIAHQTGPGEVGGDFAIIPRNIISRPSTIEVKNGITYTYLPPHSNELSIDLEKRINNIEDITSRTRNFLLNQTIASTFKAWDGDVFGHDINPIDLGIKVQSVDDYYSYNTHASSGAANTYNYVNIYDGKFGDGEYMVNKFDSTYSDTSPNYSGDFHLTTPVRAIKTDRGIPTIIDLQDLKYNTTIFTRNPLDIIRYEGKTIGKTDSVELDNFLRNNRSLFKVFKDYV